MPVQQIAPKVMQRMQYMAKNDPDMFNTLTDMAQTHGFTPGDDMTKHIQIQRDAQAQAQAREPGTVSLHQDHINALTNLQNYLYKGQDTRDLGMFETPGQGQPVGANLGNPQGIEGKQ